MVTKRLGPRESRRGEPLYVRVRSQTLDKIAAEVQRSEQSITDVVSALIEDGFRYREKEAER